MEGSLFNRIPTLYATNFFKSILAGRNKYESRVPLEDSILLVDDIDA